MLRKIFSFNLAHQLQPTLILSTCFYKLPESMLCMLEPVIGMTLTVARGDYVEPGQPGQVLLRVS